VAVPKETTMQTLSTLVLGGLLVCAGASSLSAEEVTELWTKHCASCHGADMKGQTKAGKALKVADLTAPDVRAAFDRERMIKAIKQGVTREGSDKPVMKPFSDKLTDEQIAALVDHIMATK
jgi:cytochrome c553